MTQVVRYLHDESHWFPKPDNALDEPNGLLAIGGDLSPARIHAAYQQGIFPWFNPDEPILWWSPDPRAVFRVSEFVPSKSLKKRGRKHPWRITLNHQFLSVMQACAAPRDQQGGTWITQSMQQSYLELHRQGIGHSVEVWDEDTLVGGLYGLLIGGVFCGESMFHRQTDASKIAFWALIEHLKRCGVDWVDAQVPNDHLSSLGAKAMPRSEFLELLAAHGGKLIDMKLWLPQRITLNV
ncbi:leucyl/phenylalanyl-tRNA--protein transferase [Ferrimonas aestuarii]|uniref:Leucyl/phenylalanyl-tRNA--protein transferase n=1 Tax=Ferrimonas aestuarii TaxID=2569539 RepID=A0A4U1BLS9_9GAMM|nr:leucyl/phenylalanyl-tRNA--protein transferase [Ferrimonas aestuarii]TKB53257.1 leucyl/phenylalanyl-tRNA--protein transferase [Ferrimonas aestuarii]